MDLQKAFEILYGMKQEEAARRENFHDEHKIDPKSIGVYFKESNLSEPFLHKPKLNHSVNDHGSSHQ